MSKKTKSEVEEQFVPVFGALPAKKDIREYHATLTKAAENLILPEEFELSMPNVKDQGSVGACVAFSISTCIEYFNKLQEGTDKVFSTGFIYGNRRNMNTGIGMNVDRALTNTLKYGDVYKQDFDYNVEVPRAIELFEENALDLAGKAYPHRISSYFRLDTDEQMKINLMTNGPIVFSIPWFRDYYCESKTYILKHSSDVIDGYHAMVIYGWNKDGWKFQNSWNRTFGNKGRAVLPYGTKLDTCFGIKDELIINQESERVKQLEEEIKALREQSAQKDEELKKIAEERNALVKQNEEKTQKLLEAQKEYRHIIDILNNEDLTEEQRAEYQKQKMDLEVEICVYSNDINTIQSKITEIFDTELTLIDEVIKNAEIIRTQSEQIDQLTQQLLEIETPFKKMPRWLAVTINSIINAFK